MTNGSSLKMLLGFPPEKRLLELLDRFGAQGWITIYVRRPEQIREMLARREVDLALLHPSLSSAVPASCAVPVVVAANEPLGVIEQKLTAAVVSSPLATPSRPLFTRSESTSSETGMRTPIPAPASRVGFTGSGRVGAPPSSTEIEVEGELQDTPLAVLLLDAAFGHCTGTLSLKLGDVQREFAFRDGAVVASASNIPAERLGAFLARQGLITQAQRQTLQQAMERQPGVLSGLLLLKLGLLTPATLEAALTQQVERRLAQALLNEHGSFTWSPLQPLPPERVVKGPELLDFVARQVLQDFGESQVSSMIAAEASKVVRRTELFDVRRAVLRNQPDALAISERIDNGTLLSALLDPGEILPQLRVILLLHLARAIGFSTEPAGGDMWAADLPWGPALPSLPEQERAAVPSPPPISEARSAETRTATPPGLGQRPSPPLRSAEARSSTPRPAENVRTISSMNRTLTQRGGEATTPIPRPLSRRPTSEHDSLSPSEAGDNVAATTSAGDEPGEALLLRRKEPRLPTGLMSALRRTPYPSSSRSPRERPEGGAGEDGPVAPPAAPEYRYIPPFPMAAPPSSNKAAGLVIEGRRSMLNGRFREAADYFAAAWNAEPGYCEALSLSGWCILRSDPRDEKRVKDGLENLQMAVSLSTTEALPFLRYGLALAELGRSEQAQLQLKAALKLDHNLHEAQLALNRLNARSGGS